MKGKGSNGSYAGSPTDTAPPAPSPRPAEDKDELRLVTALFADIVGSTALGEYLAMEEVKALVGECVSRMCEAVEKYGGTVGAYMGDGVAAFFGLEAADEHDRHRAALAALELREVVSDYAREAQIAWGVENLSVRIGINCGRVAIGSVGARDPKVLALGDAVNVAARLQSYADPGSIVVGASVAGALAGRFELMPLGPVELKGRVKPVEAHVLVGESASSDPDLPPAIVGREEELARLESVLSDLSSGRGQVVLLVGEAGIGKSRLLAEARRRAGSNILWLGVGLGQVDRRIPYEPFVDALRLWLGIGEGVPDIAVRVRLHARLRALVGEGSDDLVPPLARLLGVAPRTKADRRLEGLPLEVLRVSLHRSFGEWLTAVARTVPVVLAIDNFGIVDEATAQLGEELLSITDLAPLAVIASMRPDPALLGWKVRVKAHSDYSHRATEIRLDPLTDEAATDLVSSLDSRSALSDDVRSTLVRKAEGNPLYLEELFNAVAGIADGHEPDTAAELSLPAALESLLVSRVDRLPGAARDLLQAAAILGREFSREVLHRMYPEEDLDAALSVLLRADLIRERRRDPAEYAFKHGLLREAALSTLTGRRRRELHGIAAEAIEATCGPDPRDRVAELASHYLASGEVAKGARFLEDLGERLAAVYRWDQAAEVLEECRSQLELKGITEGRDRVTEKLAELRAQTGDAAGAARLLDELTGSGADATRSLALRARLLAESGDLTGAESLLSGEPASTEALPDGQIVLLSAQLALRRQDLSRTRSLLEGLGDVDTLPPEIACEASSMWAGYLAASGDFVAAGTWGKRAVAFAEKLGKVGAELRTKRQLAILHLLNGRVRAGNGLLRRVFDSCDNLGFAIGMLETGVNLVHSTYLLGRLAEGEDLSLRLLDISSSPFWQAFLHSNLAALRFEMNDLAGAENSAAKVLALDRSVTTVAPRVASLVVLSKVRAAEGRWELAEEALSRAREEAELVAGREGLLTAVRTANAELAWIRRDPARTLAEAEAALDDLGFTEKPMHVSVLRLKGMALAGSDPRTAWRLLADAHDQSRVMDLRLEEARTLVAMGLCEGEGSGERFSAAEAIFRECGCRRGLAEVGQARLEPLNA